METYEHLRLPIVASNVDRQKKGGGGGYTLPLGRTKSEFYRQAVQKADSIRNAFTELKAKFSDKITPSLIYEIEINQAVDPKGFEKTLASMRIHVLSVAENKKGYWVVFADDEDLTSFKTKLTTYGQEKGPSYDFFNAIESFQDIPIEKKIGKGLKVNPLGEKADFIDIELWKM
ncbi:MAG TPA: hypothetical protein VJL89_02380, partial [Thermodesulfovibrionia bacterium]|nr:hypothetical protein [Thermodesulfovibrionia bacterium]